MHALERRLLCHVYATSNKPSNGLILDLNARLRCGKLDSPRVAHEGSKWLELPELSFYPLCRLLSVFRPFFAPF